MSIPEIIGWIVIVLIAITIITIMGILLAAIVEYLIYKTIRLFKWTPASWLYSRYEQLDKQVQLIGLFPLSKWMFVGLIRVTDKRIEIK